MTFVYSTIRSGFHPAEVVDGLTAPTRSTMDDLGGAPGTPLDRPGEPWVILVATGGTEAAILAAADERRTATPREPLVLIAHAAHNSLPAALEALARWHQLGRRGRIVYHDGTTGAAATAALAEVIDDLAVLHRLRHTRIGQIGTPSDWLVASTPDPSVVRDRWGPELVPVEMIDLILHYRDHERSGSPVDITPWRGPAGVARPAIGHGPEDEAVTSATRIQPVLEAAIADHGLDAVAVRCFDFITELETSGCIALAALNDGGLVAGCEGDVTTTLAMLLVRQLLDAPSWVANPAQVDPATGELVLAHCTIAPTMVESVELHTHFESGLGIGIRGQFAPGWVTLLRLGGTDLDQMWLTDAEVVRGGDAPDLCRTQLTVRPRSGMIDRLLADPLGNHVVVAIGRHADRLQRWWDLAIAG